MDKKPTNAVNEKKVSNGNVVANGKAAVSGSDAAKRTRVSQSDVPAYSLVEALRVPQAISNNYGGKATKPINVATAMDLTPTSSGFKMLTGAAIAYGLTEGGYNATEISITALARQIINPLEEGADHAGKIEAYLKPRVISDFCKKYDGSPLPREDISINVLTDMGVPRDRAKIVLDLILHGAEALNLISDIKGKRFVNLSRVDNTRGKTEVVPNSEKLIRSDEEHYDETVDSTQIEEPLPAAKPIADSRTKRVFITHGKNTAFIAPIKKLLSFGELEAVVSVEMQSVSQPVPDKVMRDMRSCGAAIIHVDGEQKLLDRDATEHMVLNPNVLIEIGAAMALYGRRFILLVREGVKLPSNLQGLYEVRYAGESLDGDATIRLLESINQLKKEPLEVF